MHPLVQQFAAEKLAQEPARHHVQAYDRHARHFAALTQQHEDDFHGAADKQALAWMIGEADNIRAAWRWGVRQADGALLEQFVESFLYFFDIQGRYQECADLTGEALQALREQVATPDVRRGLGRVVALNAAFQFRLGAFEEARLWRGGGVGVAGAAASVARLRPCPPVPGGGVVWTGRSGKVGRLVSGGRGGLRRGRTRLGCRRGAGQRGLSRVPARADDRRGNPLDGAAWRSPCKLAAATC